MPEHQSVQGRPYRYVKQHRLVMEELLGRPLQTWENVHHLDGDRANNDPSNLQLWVVSQPTGQASLYLNYVVTLLEAMRAAGLTPPPWPMSADVHPDSVPESFQVPAEQFRFLLPQPEGTH